MLPFYISTQVLFLTLKYLATFQFQLACGTLSTRNSSTELTLLLKEALLHFYKMVFLNCKMVFIIHVITHAILIEKTVQLQTSK